MSGKPGSAMAVRTLHRIVSKGWALGPCWGLDSSVGVVGVMGPRKEGALWSWEGMPPWKGLMWLSQEWIHSQGKPNKTASLTAHWYLAPRPHPSPSSV